MLFKPELAQAILLASKTQTRRLVNPEDTFVSDGFYKIKAVYRNRRLKWRVGDTYAVQPGRGKSAIARFRLLRIRREDVRDILYLDAHDEGFRSIPEFLATWCHLNDRAVKCGDDGNGVAIWRDEGERLCYSNTDDFPRWLRDYRPRARYDAWVLDFELVK